MIEAHDLELIYSDGTVAVKPFNLEVGAGELVYITGASGSGKTSLLKLLIGSEYPTGGSLNILGEPIIKGNSKRIHKIRHKIGPIFQEFRLIKGKTSMDNVKLGMRFIGMTPSQIETEAQSVLIKVGLGDKLNVKVDYLSWGECQRVAIARAVARKPALILADEPTGNLDRDNAIKMLELLASFRTKETAVIMTTHATHLIEGHAHATYIHMDRGRVHVERQGKSH